MPPKPPVPPFRSPTAAARFVDAYITGLRQHLPTRHLKRLDSVQGATPGQLACLQKQYPAVPTELLRLLERSNGTSVSPATDVLPAAAPSTLESDLASLGVSQKVKQRAESAVQFLSLKLKKVASGEVGAAATGVPAVAPHLTASRPPGAATHPAALRNLVPLFGTLPFAFALRTAEEMASTCDTLPFARVRRSGPTTAAAATPASAGATPADAVKPNQDKGPEAGAAPPRHGMTTLRWMPRSLAPQTAVAAVPQGEGSPPPESTPVRPEQHSILSLFSDFGVQYVPPDGWEAVDAALAKKMSAHHHHHRRPAPAGSHTASPKPPKSPTAAVSAGTPSSAAGLGKRRALLQPRRPRSLLLVDARIDPAARLGNWLMFGESLSDFMAQPPQRAGGVALHTGTADAEKTAARPRFRYTYPRSRLFLDFTPNAAAGGMVGQVVRMTWIEGGRGVTPAGAEECEGEEFRVIAEFRVLAPDFGAYLKQIMLEDYDFTEEVGVPDDDDGGSGSGSDSDSESESDEEAENDETEDEKEVDPPPPHLFV